MELSASLFNIAKMLENHRFLMLFQAVFGVFLRFENGLKTTLKTGVFLMVFKLVFLVVFTGCL